MLLKLSMKGLSTSQDRARSSWFFWAFFMYHEFVTDDFGRRVSEMLWIYGKKERLNTYRKYSIIIYFFFVLFCLAVVDCFSISFMFILFVCFYLDFVLVVWIFVCLVVFVCLFFLLFFFLKINTILTNS